MAEPLLTPETRRRLLECGAAAPSGDNLQPWIVSWNDGAVTLSIDRGRDRSLYNFGCRASLIALGAMIENMSIAAADSRMATDVALRPDDDLLTATLTFRPADVQPDPLSSAILRRCTNRQPFKAEPIPIEIINRLKAAVPDDGSAELQIIEDRQSRRILSRAASLNDRLLFEIRRLHDEFFKSIRWTADQAERTRDGLYVKTLELGPMAPMFKAMNSWGIVRLMRIFGGSLTAPQHSYGVFMRSGALGFLQMTDRTPEAYVRGGRAIQRIWLTATAAGLGFQPMAGMLYLLPYLAEASGSVALTAAQRAVIDRARALYGRVLALRDDRAVIMLFRVGYGPAPSATSLRRVLRESPTPSAPTI